MGQKRPSTFRTLRPVNGQFLGFSFFPTFPPETVFKNRLQDGKSTGDKRFRDETFALRQAPIIIEDSANERTANTIPH